MAATADNSDLVAQIQALKAQVDTLTRRGLYPFSVTNNSGTQMISVKPSQWTDTEGNPVPVTQLRDGAGHVIFEQFPVAFDGNGNATQWAWAFVDVNNNNILTSDGLSGHGQALPHEPIPLWTEFFNTNWRSAGTGVGFTAYTDGGGILPAFSNSSAWSGSQQQVYEGQLSYVSHPAIKIQSVLGPFSGAAGVTVTATVYVNGTVVGSWTTTAGSYENKAHYVDLVGPGLASASGVPFQIKVQTSAPTTGQIYCAMLAWQVGTPSAFG